MIPHEIIEKKSKLSLREGGASIVDTPGKELCTKSFSVIIIRFTTNEFYYY